MVWSAAVLEAQVVDRVPVVSPTPGSAAVASNRISGVDIARALAVLGMFVVHVGPGSVEPIFKGRATALFIALARVSIALLSGGRSPARGLAANRAAVRIAVRAALLVPLSLLLTALGTDILVILTFYGAYFRLFAMIMGGGLGARSAGLG